VIAFLALFVNLTISLPDGAVHLGGFYCAPVQSAPGDWWDYSSTYIETNCDRASRIVRLHLYY